MFSENFGGVAKTFKQLHPDVEERRRLLRERYDSVVEPCSKKEYEEYRQLTYNELE